MERRVTESPPVARDQTVYSENGPLRIPLNLTEWVAPEKLAAWVREEIEKLDPAKPDVHEFRRMLPELRAEVTLGVMVYAYSVQVFTSDEIVRACQSDPVFKGFCGERAPFPEQLEHFRRKHRSLLEAVMVQILIRAVKERYVQLGKLPPGLEYGLLRRAVDRIDTARHMDACDD